MEYPIFIHFAVMLIFLAMSTSAQDEPTTEQTNLEKLANASNYFGINIYQQLAKDDQDNIFFSPFSVSTVLGMVYVGAQGQSEKELQSVLGYEKVGLSRNDVSATFKTFLDGLSSEDNKGYILNSGNAAYIDQNLKVIQEYKDETEKSFKAEVKNADFNQDNAKVISEINNFVSNTTNGKISNFISELNQDTVMFLLNAVYFYGNWNDPFDPEKTEDETFYNHGISSEQTQVPMMHQLKSLPYADLDDAQVLELAYVGKNACMVILLPKEKSGLADVESKLDIDQFTQIMKSLSKQKVDISFPKFKLEYSKNLSPEVSALGAESIFGDNADFRGITSGNGIKVSEIQHKAMVDVNEKGSEAAATTGVDFITKSALQPIIQNFVADHPFLFFMVEKKSKMILFFGRVTKF